MDEGDDELVKDDGEEDGLSYFDASTWRCDRCADKETAARAREEAMRLKQLGGAVPTVTR